MLGRVRPSPRPVPAVNDATLRAEKAALRAEKAALRARFRAARLALSDTEAASHSLAICDRIAALPEIEAAETVHLYWPIPARREVDTRPLIHRLVAADVRVVLPVVADLEGTGTGGVPRLRHVVFEGETAMRPNRWGIAEPIGTEEVDPAALDAVVVPAFGAGRAGHRIGHGRGFYDAFLADLTVPTVGAVYAACLVEAIPAEAHDQALGVIVTEQEVWRVE